MINLIRNRITMGELRYNKVIKRMSINSLIERFIINFRPSFGFRI